MQPCSRVLPAWQKRETDAAGNWTEDSTPFDFIVVGSGAGGAPLAARLIERGFRVLVIEMGPGLPEKPSDALVENSEVPVLHPETTEDERYSLRYFVKHFDSDPDGSRDPKLYRPDDQATFVGDRRDETGIFYPRAQGVGGCTIHNAMITVCGPAEDWDEIAEATDDPSWRGERMRVYFERLEKCLYDRPLSWLGRLAASLGFPTGWENGRHGKRGWLHTSLADLRLLKREKKFTRLIVQSTLATLESGVEQIQDWVRPLLKARAGPGLDPNHWETMRQSPAGISLIPCSITADGRRSGPRQRLLDALNQSGDRSRLLSEHLVTGLVFEESTGDSPTETPTSEGGPCQRVIGVKVLGQAHVYQADPRAKNYEGDPQAQSQVILCRREVILCGGAFNTPQLLMLSGIGPREELDKHGIATRVDLPGVGRNLQDRYEVPIVAKLSDRFRGLDNLRLTSFKPDAELDTELRQWISRQGGLAGDNLCATNGGLLAILQRSKQERSTPDLFMFCVLGRFRGYSVGYSKPSCLQPGDSSSQQPFAAGDHKQYLTWLILKARTKNNQGRVTLRDNNPLRRPEINFRSFPGLPEVDQLAGKDLDLEALWEGVQTVRNILAVGTKKGLIADVDLPWLAEKFNGDERQWIKHTAWGHHACGTCRIGADSDQEAVLDSRFRVRQVEGLRVVDASIFPRIFGYFIVANIYMASEKAADVISEDHGKLVTGGEPVLPSRVGYEQRRAYPTVLEQREAALVRERREKAGFLDGSCQAPASWTQRPWLLNLVSPEDGAENSSTLPRDTRIGLVGRRHPQRDLRLGRHSGLGPRQLVKTHRLAFDGFWGRLYRNISRTSLRSDRQGGRHRWLPWRSVPGSCSETHSRNVGRFSLGTDQLAEASCQLPVPYRAG